MNNIILEIPPNDVLFSSEKEHDFSKELIGEVIDLVASWENKLIDYKLKNGVWLGPEFAVKVLAKSLQHGIRALE